MTTPAEYIAAHPEFPWLWVDDVTGVATLMRRLGWRADDEDVLAVERAGEGNMNLTLRVTTTRRSVILKQARPWVEKYDHIAAPWDRAVFEQRFYGKTAALAGVAERMPALLGADDLSRTLLLEDLGTAGDYADLYAGGPLSEAELDAVGTFLAALHGGTRGRPDPTFANRDMRALNHAHIYMLPLSGQLDLPLDDHEAGLADAAARLRRDDTYVDSMRRTGERYLMDGPCLLHGDCFPGSWLRTVNGLRLIDPEFCFYGDPEFDIAVTVAHLALARRDQAAAERFVAAASAEGPPLDTALLAHYAGAEVMRRLLGVAQLPIAPTDGWRRDLLLRSRAAVRESAVERLF